MTKVRFVQFGVAVALGFLTANLPAQEPFPGLDAYVTKAMADWKIPGLSIAIVRNDSVLYAKGFGVLKAGSTTPVNEQTLFEIGSTSKAFTATLVAMLVGDGKMRFDDRVTEYLPGFKLADPVANAEVTIRDAMTHRSGIGRGELAWLGAGISREEVLRRVRFLKPESPFRSRYSYQNMMFLAAGEAAGKAAGSSWDALIRQRIFEPLGMSVTITSSTGMTNRNVGAPHGMVRDSVYAKPHGNLDNIAPAGSILSSAQDMAQWLRFQLADGVYNGKRLVSSAAFRQTHTPQILTGGGGGAAPLDSIGLEVFSAYGMGWSITGYRRQLVWQHGGGTDGSSAQVAMLPEQKFGVVVLSNMAGAQLPGILQRYIFDRQLNAPMRDLSGEAYRRVLAQRQRVDSAAANTQRKAAVQPPLPLTAFTGTYVDSLYGEARVTLQNGKLQLRRGEWYGPLEYWNGSNFQWTILPSSPTGPLFIKFDVAADDTVNGLYFGLGSDQSLMSRQRPSGPGRSGGPGGM